MSSTENMVSTILQQIESSTSLFNAYSEVFSSSLELQGFNQTTAKEIASKVLCEWHEVLSQQYVDDEYGVPLTIEMLPLTTTSVLLIDSIFKRQFDELEIAKIIVAWNYLRGKMLDSVFLPADDDRIVEETIVFTSTMHIVPDNDIELCSTLPFRLFSSREAAANYDGKGI